MKSALSKEVERKVNQWTREAEIAFASAGQCGIKMHRETWANGEVMVGFDGARTNQFIPLHIALRIYDNGWKA